MHAYKRLKYERLRAFKAIFLYRPMVKSKCLKKRQKKSTCCNKYFFKSLISDS